MKTPFPQLDRDLKGFISECLSVSRRSESPGTNHFLIAAPLL